MISAIQTHLPSCDLLIVDDASPDGTCHCVAEIGARIEEIPITFIDLRVGKSKKSGAIMLEALRYGMRRSRTRAG